MGKKILTTPISAADLEGITVGDIIYLSGYITTCRDVAHRRVVEENLDLPIDIRDGAIFHAGPIIRTLAGQKGKYEVVSIGPTTSMRMEKFEKKFVAATGVRLIVGKGGMSTNTEEACKENKALHCVFPAGCAVIAATKVEEIIEVHWTELGMPESLWTCKVKEFGPLIVSIDTNGNNLFKINKEVSSKAKDVEIEKISEQIHFIK
ncbi:MAG: L(+)-tartrate dehydratase subunit beta [Caldicoprobacterales bacterium]|jgi:L(+)-tartrate dehydratase beta subunit